MDWCKPNLAINHCIGWSPNIYISVILSKPEKILDDAIHRKDSLAKQSLFNIYAVLSTCISTTLVSKNTHRKLKEC